MQNKVTKQIIGVDQGFNWLAFILGGIYYPFKGMPGLGFFFWVLDLILALTTFGLGNLIVGLYRGADFKNVYMSHLLKRDFIAYTTTNS
jgi:hypothetical protein